MNYSITLLLLLISFLYSNAQFSDNFEDGDLTNGTSWSGDTQKFKVNTDKQLQLNTTGEGVSYLSAELLATGIVEWNIRIKLSFSPSDNNHTLIYLVSDCPDLLAPLNGYYLKLGETGSSDAIELYRQSQSEHFLVARGTGGFLKDPFDVRVKVVRDDGHWQLFADSTGGNDFALQVEGNDDYWQEYGYFGIVCRYTSSNSTKFRFDDIYAGPLIIDSKPPELLESVVSGASSIDLYFSEPLKTAPCAQLSNYEIDNDFGYPVAAGRDVGQPSLVHLQFLDQFIEGQEYQLTISNLQDEAGNVMPLTTETIIYDPVRPFDVLISEIMADPSPAVGLPECEYLELYNKTNHRIRIDGWKLIIGESVKDLPTFTIDPQSYHLLTENGCDTLLSIFGTVTSIPGFGLLNTGCPVALKDMNDALIHQVTYDPAWYGNAFKESGGWSLEMIDPINPCGADENWAVSVDQSGGTPGRLNSVNAVNPDITLPRVSWIAVPDSVSVKVAFSEVMDSLTLINPYNYSVDHGFGYPLSVIADPMIYNAVTLRFSTAFSFDTVYCLTINTGLSDCSGNKLDKVIRLPFGLPAYPDSSDLVINELLFDPRTSCSEFAEIYNRSHKVITFKDLHVALRDPVTGTIVNPGIMSDESRIIFPGEYFVLTNEPDLVKAEYITPNPENFLKCDFPSLANSGGTVVVATKTGDIIDEFTYSEDMHFPLLNTTKGISLERVDYNRPSFEAGNWHSAATSAGFATPAFRNSQFMQGSAGDSEILVEPVTISPDNDGFNDQLMITCRFNSPGNLVTIRVFDDEGRFIRLLTGNYLAGESCTFNWDGTDDAKQRVSSGIYIVYTELININGTVNQFKDVVVVAGF